MRRNNDSYDGLGEYNEPHNKIYKKWVKKCIKNMLFFFYFKGFYGIIIYVYRSTYL